MALERKKYENFEKNKKSDDEREGFNSCVRSPMLYGSETWYLREKKMTILRRTKRATIQAICGAKLLNPRNRSR